MWRCRPLLRLCIHGPSRAAASRFLLASSASTRCLGGAEQATRRAVTSGRAHPDRHDRDAAEAGPREEFGDRAPPGASRSRAQPPPRDGCDARPPPARGRPRGRPRRARARPPDRAWTLRGRARASRPARYRAGSTRSGRTGPRRPATNPNAAIPREAAQAQPVGVRLGRRQGRPRRHPYRARAPGLSASSDSRMQPLPRPEIEDAVEGPPRGRRPGDSVSGRGSSTASVTAKRRPQKSRQPRMRETGRARPGRRDAPRSGAPRPRPRRHCNASVSRSGATPIRRASNQRASPRRRVDPGRAQRARSPCASSARQWGSRPRSRRASRPGRRPPGRRTISSRSPAITCASR